jgi:hypothetical protein
MSNKLSKHSAFRKWVHDLWLLNCDEHEQYQQPKFSQTEYFQMYKFWLKREYKHQQRSAR